MTAYRREEWNESDRVKPRYKIKVRHRATLSTPNTAWVLGRIWTNIDNQSFAWRNVFIEKFHFCPICSWFYFKLKSPYLSPRLSWLLLHRKGAKFLTSRHRTKASQCTDRTQLSSPVSPWATNPSSTFENELQTDRRTRPYNKRTSLQLVH